MRWSDWTQRLMILPGVVLPWTAGRLRAIESGVADPNEVELQQWRDAMCRRVADAGEGDTVWIVPVTDDLPPEAFAAFMWHFGNAPEEGLTH
jgi:hypothetical protein